MKCRTRECKKTRRRARREKVYNARRTIYRRNERQNRKDSRRFNRRVSNINYRIFKDRQNAILFNYYHNLLSPPAATAAVTPSAPPSGV